MQPPPGTEREQSHPQMRKAALQDQRALETPTAVQGGPEAGDQLHAGPEVALTCGCAFPQAGWAAGPRALPGCADPVKAMTSTANLPDQNEGTRAGLQGSDHLAPISAPPLGLGDVVWHSEAPNKGMAQALNDTPNHISLRNTEIAQMREPVLHNRKA